MKTLLILLTALFLLKNSFAQQAVNIVVVTDKNEIPPSSPLAGYTTYPTLVEAYNSIIVNNGSVNATHNIILYGTTPINLGASQLIWTKSGTSTFPINIFSYDKQVTLTRTADTLNSTFIKFKDVSYLKVNNIHFKNATYGILLENTDYSSITYCRFTGELITESRESGAIWIGVDTVSSTTHQLPEKRSEFNDISHNLIEGQKFSNYCSSQYNHGIYISWGSHNNIFFGNTILSDDFVDNVYYPLGSGFQINHGFQENNVISNNFIKQFYYKATYNMCGTQNPDSNYCIGYDNIQNSRFGLILDYDSKDANGKAAQISHILSNQITNNYGYANIDLNKCEKTINLQFHKNSELSASNIMSSNREDFDSPYPYDPYWQPHAAGALSTVATVSGDFDQDGLIDDIAVIYEFPNSETQIHVWTHDSLHYFTYKGMKWSNRTPVNLGGFSASRIKGRVVSGSFDNDTYYDDIAAIYDNGTGGIAIQMFLGDNTNQGFIYEGGSRNWKSFSSGFNASKITGRVVSGDFNNDTKSDIATFYDLGGSGTEVNMFLSTGTSFTYEGGSQNWWSVSSGFNSNKIIDRVVSGDFDNDGVDDDIVAFYDVGNAMIEAEVFISNGTRPFTYNGGSLNWWSNNGQGAFDANKITGRVVSGDFDGDGSNDDVATFYDSGNNSVEVDMFLSTGQNFVYKGGSQSWWTSLNAGGFDASKVTYSIVSGALDEDSIKNDIVAFYNYNFQSGNVRTNVWESTGISFIYINSSLGYPWINTSNGAQGGRIGNQVSKAKPDAKESPEVKFDVYPNPIEGDFSISYHLLKNDIVNLKFYSMNGKVIKNISSYESEGVHLIKLNKDDLNLGSGLLLIQLTTGGKSYPKKILIK